MNRSRHKAETPAVLLASDTAILMGLFGCVQIEFVKGSLRLKSSPPPIRMKDRLDAHGPFPAIRAAQPAFNLFEFVHTGRAV